MARAKHIDLKDDIVRVPIDELKESDWNPNEEDRQTLDALKASIRQNGLVVPLVVREADNSIIGGHHRLYAIRELMGEGWKLHGNTVPVIHVDATEEQAKRLNLALNKITGQPNLDRLGALLKELHDISGPEELAATGYSPHEIDDLLELLETDRETLYQSIPDHQAGEEGDEGWVDLSFRLPGSAAELVRDELKRLKGICSFKTQNADGLALEKMAVLSSLTPRQSVQ
jgi:hypothetical protein